MREYGINTSSTPANRITDCAAAKGQSSVWVTDL